MTDKELQTVDATPAAMIQTALDKGVSPTDLTELYKLYERDQANNARKAYHRAVAAFKADPPDVYKDKPNQQYGSRYTSKDNLMNTVNPALSKEGLNARFDFRQDGGIISVTCILTHEDGHSEGCTLAGPPDQSGKKNALQQIKSTVTYLEIATYEAIMGLASSDPSDDDGNSAVPGSLELITDAQALVLESRATDHELLKVFLDWVESKTGDRHVASIPARSFDSASRALDKAIKGRQEISK